MSVNFFGNKKSQNSDIRDSHINGPQHIKKYDREATKKTLLLCLGLVATFMTIELVGGLISKSLALVADSIHMLTDFVSIILALFGVIVASFQNNSKKTYGYSRFEVIMSLINSLFLVFICIYIAVEAFIRMQNPQVIDIKIMLPVAISGLVINFLTMYLFHRNEKNTVKEYGSKNLLMHSAFLHFLTDAISSCIVIVAGVIIYYTGWHLVDPILSLMLVVMIGRSAFSIILPAVHILMEGSPADISNKEIEDYLELNINEVLDVHHIHLWMLNEQENLITLHAVVKNNSDIHDVTLRIKVALKEKYKISHSTIQLEKEGEECLDSAY